jgi:DHA1 family bicyclomycin/chloramphenicol resistance-like MFS transporter
MEAGNIRMLIILRAVQAIGGCASMVAAMAMVRDLFGAKDSAKVFSLLLLVLGASPLIAPTVGGYIVTTFGWRFVFLILAVLSVIILLLTIFFLPDSYPADPHFSLKPGPIIRNFLSVLRVPRFSVYSLVQAFAFASLFAYVSGSPIVFMGIFHVDKRTYGWIFALLSVAFIGLSQFNSLLLKRYPSERIIPVALTGQVVLSLVFFVGCWKGWYGLGATISLLFMLLACIGYTYPNATAVAMAPFEKNAGTASALLGAMQMAIGSLASIAVSVFANGRTTPMAAVMLVSTVVAGMILAMGAVKRLPRAAAEARDR